MRRRLRLRRRRRHGQRAGLRRPRPRRPRRARLPRGRTDLHGGAARSSGRRPRTPPSGAGPHPGWSGRGRAGGPGERHVRRAGQRLGLDRARRGPSGDDLAARHRRAQGQASPAVRVRAAAARHGGAALRRPHRSLGPRLLPRLVRPLPGRGGRDPAARHAAAAGTTPASSRSNRGSDGRGTHPRGDPQGAGRLRRTATRPLDRRTRRAGIPGPDPGGDGAQRDRP